MDNRDKKLDKTLKKLIDYDIHILLVDEIGHVNVDNLIVNEEYIIEILEEILNKKDTKEFIDFINKIDCIFIHSSEDVTFEDCVLLYDSLYSPNVRLFREE